MINHILLLLFDNVMLKLILDIESKIFIIQLLHHVVLFELGYSILVLKIEELFPGIRDSVEDYGYDGVVELAGVWVVLLAKLVGDVNLLAVGDVEDEEVLDQLVDSETSVDEQ